MNPKESNKKIEERTRQQGGLAEDRLSTDLEMPMVCYQAATGSRGVHITVALKNTLRVSVLNLYAILLESMTPYPSQSESRSASAKRGLISHSSSIEVSNSIGRPTTLVKLPSIRFTKASPES